MTAEQAQSIARTLLKIIGAFLVAKGLPTHTVDGLVTSPDVIDIVAGGASALSGAVWSWLTHKAA